MNISKKKLTIRNNEEPAKASGMATEVILSNGPFRYVCLWRFWKYLCFSISFSRGLKGGSVILHYVLKSNDMHLKATSKTRPSSHTKAHGDMLLIFY